MSNSEPPTSSQDNGRPRSRVADLAVHVETLARAGAILLGLTYASGFVVVTLHHAQYGVVDLSLLRVRVFSAGVLMMAFTVLPAIVAARLFGMMGLESKTALFVKHNPKDRALQQATIILAMYTTCVALAFGIWPVVFDHTFYSRGPIWAYVVLWIVMVSVAPLAARYFENHPRLCTLVVASAMIGAGCLAAVGPGTRFLGFTVWLYSCEVATVWAQKALTEPRIIKTIEFERTVGLPLGLMVLFSTVVYGNVYAKFGGGAPLPILAHLNPEAASILGGGKVSCWLMDQTDSGVYVLRTRDDKGAVFLRRESVRGIEFQFSRQSSDTGQ